MGCEQTPGTPGLSAPPTSYWTAPCILRDQEGVVEPGIAPPRGPTATTHRGWTTPRALQLPPSPGHTRYLGGGERPGPTLSLAERQWHLPPKPCYHPLSPDAMECAHPNPTLPLPALPGQRRMAVIVWGGLGAQGTGELGA